MDPVEKIQWLKHISKKVCATRRITENIASQHAMYCQKMAKSNECRCWTNLEALPRIISSLDT